MPKSQSRCRTDMSTLATRTAQSRERQWPGVSLLYGMGLAENFMTSHSIDADIKVKWPEGQSAYSPGTAEELTLIALDLLVREMGSDAARTFVDQVFERYRHEPFATLP